MTAPSGESSANNGYFASSLDEARYYARKGRYNEALQLLAIIESNSQPQHDRADLLDLQGRIFAQQGFYLEAEKCWRMALTLAPSNVACAAALERIRQRRRPMMLSRVILTSLIVVMVLVLFFYQINFSTSRYENLQRGIVRDMSAIKNDLQGLAQRITASEEHFQSHLDRLIQPMQEVQGELTETIRRIEQDLVTIKSGQDQYLARTTATQKEIMQSVESRWEAMAAEGAARYKTTTTSLSVLNRLQEDTQSRIAALSDRMTGLMDETNNQFFKLNNQVQQTLEQITNSPDTEALE